MGLESGNLRGQEINKRSNLLLERMRKAGLSDVVVLAAQGAARVGARRVLELHGASPEVLQTFLKEDAASTPVTAADLRSGEIIRKILGGVFPEDFMLDEEAGASGSKGSKREWYVDPLDGTSSFAREQEFSTVGIAMYERGQPRVASICHPFERALLVAEADKGSFSFPLDERLSVVGDAKKNEVSERGELKGGIVFLDALFNGKTSPHKLELIKKLVEFAKGNLGVRMTGSNIGQQAEVARGRAELTITDAVGGFYDLAPGSLMIKEAGGEFVGLDGNPVNEKTQVALGGNKKLVELVLPILQDCYKGYQGFK